MSEQEQQRIGEIIQEHNTLVRQLAATVQQAKAVRADYRRMIRVLDEIIDQGSRRQFLGHFVTDNDWPRRDEWPKDSEVWELVDQAVSTRDALLGHANQLQQLGIDPAILQ